MSLNNTAAAYTRKYNSSLRLASQQMMQRFAGTYLEMPGIQVGERVASDEIFGQTQGKLRQQRFEPVEPNNPSSTRPWIVQAPYSGSMGIDKLDMESTVLDLKGAYTRAGVADVNRFLDQQFYGQLFAPMIVGQNATDTQVFDNTNYVVPVATGASSATGMNSEKLLAGRQTILAGDVDLSNPDNQIFVGINAAMERSLLDDPRISSSQYRNTMIFDSDQNGRQFLTGWYGMTFIHSEYLLKDTNGYYNVPMWAKAGMQAATWDEINGDVRQLDNFKQKPWLIETSVNKNWTRTEQKLVVEIKSV